ncbi:MAG: DUF4834 domain-containing protein [Sphingobacteriaceae bacterium]|nr:MAG: DUF4834 domain-containing protein [Sphingobacteriaceae bacterium]
MVLLRFLIISILILYVVRLIMRLLAPYLFQSIVNKAQQQQQQYYRNNQQEQPAGRIKVDYVPDSKKSNIPDSEGEFVDYEEVKK